MGWQVAVVSVGETVQPQNLFGTEFFQSLLAYCSLLWSLEMRDGDLLSEQT